MQSFDWLHSKFKFQIQIFKFKTNFCVCRFLLQNVFLKLINIFVFFVVILVDAFSGSIKTEKSQKNVFTLAENNFRRWKHLLELKRNFIRGNETGSPGRAVSLYLTRSGSQSEHRVRRILPARGACHVINTFIISSRILQSHFHGDERKTLCWTMTRKLNLFRFFPNTDHVAIPIGEYFPWNLDIFMLARGHFNEHDKDNLYW